MLVRCFIGTVESAEIFETVGLGKITERHRKKKGYLLVQTNRCLMKVGGRQRDF